MEDMVGVVPDEKNSCSSASSLSAKVTTEYVNMKSQ